VSAIGRWSAVGAVLAAVLSLATWRGGDGASATPTLDGRDVFAVKGCASCHDSPDTRARVGGFPSLADAQAWADERKPEMEAAAYLAESIAAPGAFRSPAFTGANGPTDAMPTLRLTTAEIDALVTYLLED
jgi:mono/diheme cytochrome c family protein